MRHSNSPLGTIVTVSLGVATATAGHFRIAGEFSPCNVSLEIKFNPFVEVAGAMVCSTKVGIINFDLARQMIRGHGSAAAFGRRLAGH